MDEIQSTLYKFQNTTIMQDIQTALKSHLHGIADKIIDKENVTPIFLGLLLRRAAWDGLTEATEYAILRGANLEFSHKESTALALAAQNGFLDVVKVLVNKGADIHSHNDLPLRIAALKGHIHVMEYLLDCGANINASPEYASALALAVESENIATIDFLLSKDADIHVGCDDSVLERVDYPLTYACSNGLLEISKLLIDNGANVHGFENYPLHFACLYGHKEIVRMLADHGANIHSHSDMALAKASLGKSHEVVGLLLARGAVVKDALGCLLELDDVEALKFLIDFGVNITIHQDTLLENAARYGKEQILNYLIVRLNMIITKKSVDYIEARDYTMALDLIHKRELKEKLSADLTNRHSSQKRTKI
jgi:ankyrin repeat protein